MKKKNDLLQFLKVVGGILAAAVLLAAVTTKGSTPSYEESGKWTAKTLARSIDEDSVNVATGQPSESNDVRCMDTPKTKSDGTGWYLCSYRDQGSVQFNIYTVEVTSDTWQSSFAATGELPSGMDKEKRMAYANNLLSVLNS